VVRIEEKWHWISKLVTGYFHSGPGYSIWRSHGTTDWLLTYTISGLGRYGHALGEIICKPGDAVLLKPSALHDYGVEPTRQYWEFVWAHFHPRPGWLPLLDWSEEAPGLMRLDLSASSYRERISTRFMQAHELEISSDRRAEELAMNALEEVLLWCDAANPREHQAMDPRIAAVMEHCCRNLSEHITLRLLSKFCGISPSRLSYLFQAEVGLPPMRWLEHQRLARAKDLLEVTVDPVHAIAGQVGFSDAFYFSARFRRALGKSPRAWRRAALLARQELRKP
jgi:AraC family transcriptional regulator of arabinose operon